MLGQGEEIERRVVAFVRPPRVGLREREQCESGPGRILLFTGVRYQRPTEASGEVHMRPDPEHASGEARIGG